MLDCPLEREYTGEEWARFLDCARHSFESGEGLHKEFSAKIGEHGVREERVRRSLTRQASLLIYQHSGWPRLALWHPETELFIIAALPDGLILNAYLVERVSAYARRLTGARWLWNEPE